MIELAFDMETSDPDDVFTLCMLAHHPQVKLKGVTVTPGSRHQIGLVKHILKMLGKDIPVGAKNINHPKECVSEFHYSVCHGVVYDQEMHEYMQPHKDKNPGLNLMIQGMDHYLKRHPSGKAFHDPLAACVAIDPSVCQFEEVELYRQKGEWGSRRSDNPNARISISVDMEKFRKVIVGEYNETSQM